MSNCIKIRTIDLLHNLNFSSSVMNTRDTLCVCVSMSCPSDPYGDIFSPGEFGPLKTRCTGVPSDHQPQKLCDLCCPHHPYQDLGPASCSQALNVSCSQQTAGASQPLSCCEAAMEHCQPLAVADFENCSFRPAGESRVMYFYWKINTTLMKTWCTIRVFLGSFSEN